MSITGFGKGGVSEAHIDEPNAYYEIFDDWEDNKLTLRDSTREVSADEGIPVYIRYPNISTFRPEWTTESGTPSASGGVLTLNNAEISTPSTFNVGAWEWSIQKSGGTGAYAGGQLYYSGAAVYYVNAFLHATAASGFDVGVHDAVDGAWIIGATPGQDTSEHTIKTTRDSSSNWELLFDGVSQGTTTDSTTTSFDALYFFEANAVNADFDDLRVY